MRPTVRRECHHSPKTLRRGSRRGFTLVEMLVAVTLVMLMMLMFAEIFGLAQEIISKQKGIAANDQKARILAEVLRNDLKNRTFREVYPFKTELELTTSGGNVTPVPTIPAPDSDHIQVLGDREGYFSFSENDPGNDSDDVLQFTIDLQRRMFGRAGMVDIDGDGSLSNAERLANRDFPAFDDSIFRNHSGASSMAEVCYFLRDGNLYRSVLLIREPYQSPNQKDYNPNPPDRSTWGNATPAQLPQPNGPPFWRNFDYSAYRQLDLPNTASVDELSLQFHGGQDLSNNPESDANPWKWYPLPGAAAGAPVLCIPRSLGAPQLRYGFSLTYHGQPMAFAGTLDSSAAAVNGVGSWAGFKSNHWHFSRLTTQERSDGFVTYPSSGFVPFRNGLSSSQAQDADGDGVIDLLENNNNRRGVDLMLPNVHGFDVEVWDDIVGQFVDLGHSLSGDNPYTDANGDGSLQDPPSEYEPGFYHFTRLRTNDAALADPPDSNPGAFGSNYSGVPDDFGNRYDTWCPNMFIADDQPNAQGEFASGTSFYRVGRAPYRPLKGNGDPNDAGSVNHARSIDFGDTTVSDGDDGEAPLKAIRITVRYRDPHSGLTSQVTIEQSLSSD